MRKTLASLVLAGLLCVPAFAGIIDDPGYTPPPPQRASVSTSVNTFDVVEIIGLGLLETRF